MNFSVCKWIELGVLCPEIIALEQWLQSTNQQAIEMHSNTLADTQPKESSFAVA